jgi:hypothetical protein
VTIHRVSIRPTVSAGAYRLSIEGLCEVTLAVGDGVILGNPRNRTVAHSRDHPGHVFLPLVAMLAHGAVDEEATGFVSRNALRLDWVPEKQLCRVTVLQAEVAGDPVGPMINHRRIATGSSIDLVPGAACLVDIGAASPSTDGRGARIAQGQGGAAGLGWARLRIDVLCPEPAPLAEVEPPALIPACVLLTQLELGDRAVAASCWLRADLSLRMIAPALTGFRVSRVRGRLCLTDERDPVAELREIPLDGSPVWAGRYRLSCWPIAGGAATTIASGGST